MAIHETVRTIHAVCAACPPQAYDFMSLVKSAGVGFIAFPVVYYIIRTFGKQISADVKFLWSKWTNKADAAIQAEVVKL